MRRSRDERCGLRALACPPVGPDVVPPTTRRSGLPNRRLDCENAYTAVENMIRNPATANGTDGIITPVSSAPMPRMNPMTDHTMRRRACVRRLVELTVEANFGSSAYRARSICSSRRCSCSESGTALLPAVRPLRGMLAAEEWDSNGRAPAVTIEDTSPVPPGKGEPWFPTSRLERDSSHPPPSGPKSAVSGSGGAGRWALAGVTSRRVCLPSDEPSEPGAAAGAEQPAHIGAQPVELAGDLVVAAGQPAPARVQYRGRHQRGQQPPTAPPRGGQA